MKKIGLLLVVLFSLTGCELEYFLAPECLEERIAEILEEDVWNPPAALFSYEYKGETVYFISQHCCDIPSELYDSNCNLICLPDGGITGNGDGQCDDFFELRTNEKLIWIDPRAACERTGIVDEEKFDNAPGGGANIISASINDDCLIIQFGASGCNGATWKTELIASPLVMESLPPQRQLKFSLVNNEDCEAYFTRYESFDISALKIAQTNRLYLNLNGFDSQLLYNY